MQLLQSEQWVTDAPFPFFDDTREFQVWLGNSVRSVRRIGNGNSSNFSPGTVVFTDCDHPSQNVLCDVSRIKGWRMKS